MYANENENIRQAKKKNEQAQEALLDVTRDEGAKPRDPSQGGSEPRISKPRGAEKRGPIRGFRSERDRADENQAEGSRARGVRAGDPIVGAEPTHTQANK